MRHERCRSIDGRNILPQSVGQAVSAWWTPRKLAIPLGALVLGGLLVLARREYALAVYVALSFAAIGATPPDAIPTLSAAALPFLALALFEFLTRATASPASLAGASAGARGRVPMGRARRRHAPPSR